jgi:alpha-amylase
MKKTLLFSLFLLCFAFGTFAPAKAADPEKRIILQAFWWDYWNSNFPDSYANYLTELAPRLRDAGINAVWVPPFVKNTGTNSVGYSPFDFYDLGDKYQKGSVTTRFGTKDDVLRMIAVMHANGIEVIADAVLNHVVGAGGEDGGAGGEDPNAWDDKWKNFRYVCYETPYKDGKQADYWNRKGRWPKNWQNFHANKAHQQNSDDWTAGHWGPDVCYYEGAYGQSSNVNGYNPVQSANYMRNEARNWIMWFKKQTAVDGFRWDAVKHFPDWAQQDFLYNVKYGMSDWCNGGQAMFSVGEYIGSKNEIDNYCMGVQYANGWGEFAMGGYDVPLRGAIKNGVIDGGGYGNLGAVVGEQLGMRYNDYGDGQRVHRSLNYINSHDTFRPIVDEKGNYKDWDGYNELGGHADPFNQRMGMAYATIMAMDGNVSVFMEDLFNLSNSNRYNHMPADEKSLPMRDYLKNLIWCHQNLAFKYGDYKVRYQTEDLLVIERSGKAIIAITDDGANAHDVWIDTDFRNVQLKDYSGGTSGERTAWGDGRFNVRVTPADGKGGLGYAVWAPIYESNYTPYRNKVTQQEWEMADDLGDSHCNSLGQGGALPEKSCEQRLVGKIYVEKGKKITYNVYQEKTGNDVTFALYDLDGNQLHKKNSTKTITGTYTPTYTGCVAMKVWNTVNTNAGQKCWVNVAYQAPATVTGTMSDRADTRASIWTGNAGNTNWTDCGNWEQGKVPNASSTVVIPDNGDVQPVVSGNVTIKKLLVENGTGSSSNPDIVVNGKLTVSSSESKAGTTYVCGKGTINLGTKTGKFETGKLTDIDESQLYADLSIFPNPATSVLYIQSGELPQGEAFIYNTSGKLCKTVLLQGEEITAVEVADLSAGVYILRLGTQTLRFIKQ